MKLSEALALAHRAGQRSEKAHHRIALVCGFSPLHLETYLAAHLKQRFPEASVEIRTGVYGDLPGNLERVGALADTPIVLMLEWQDLDPRLGARSSGGWGSSARDSILAEVPRVLERLYPLLASAASRNTLVLCPPTLPLPPLGHTSLAQASPVELKLGELLNAFLLRAGETPGCRVISRERIHQLSPASSRFDAKLDLAAGFPYHTAHADVLASLLVPVVFPPVPKKGLITDLDDTLWKGILGEIGADRIAWDLSGHAQHHALYQQCLAALADQGVLIACASKNEASEADTAFARTDLLLPASVVFPKEVHWNAKSESVGRILKTWNILPDSVVFVDDSAIELAEVQARYPGITALLFPRGDVQGVWDLLVQLKELFGKPQVLEEDRIRAASLMRNAEWTPEEGGAPASTEFLKDIAAVITIATHKDPKDPRPLELVNKTNQFNLNGKRYTEAEWRALLEDPHSFVWTVSYTDKFGPLGKIAVVTGCRAQATPEITSWVMSCRAFSRRIEHHVLERIYNEFAAQKLALAYRPTEKNKPLQDFLSTLGVSPESALLAATDFAGLRPELPHEVVLKS